MSSEFVITSNTCPESLAPGKSCKIGVSFAPGELGQRGGTLKIVDNARNSPQRVKLGGAGVRPRLKFRPKAIVFHAVPFDRSGVSKDIEVINLSEAPVQIDNVSIVGSSDFSVTSGCPQQLLALAQCSLTVTFTPTKFRLQRARLKIKDSALGSPQHIPLSGE